MMDTQAAVPHIRVSGLTITAQDPERGLITIIDDVSFAIGKGEVLALIGESGSGKTTTALALMGYTRGGAQIAKGSIHVSAQDILTLDDDALLQLRGNRIAYVAQSAVSAFNPSRRIMEQVIEAALSHGVMDRPKAEAKAVSLFEALALPFPKTIGSRYPHQVSGGQLQRLMAAMALITDPELVIFDEPTTALDVTTQIEVLRAFKKAVQQVGTTAVYVSHDLAVVAQMADHIVVLKGGCIRESDTTTQVLHNPKDDYTKTLMAAARPAERILAAANATPIPLLNVQGLYAGYGRPDKQGNVTVPVLHNVQFTLQRGATLGVIGESGSGKSTMARVIAGLLPASRGFIKMDGGDLAPALANRSREQLRRIQLVFQNADVVLNPAHTIAEILARPLAFYHGIKGERATSRVTELLDLVRLPAHLASRTCDELSGGQKQRINLARALAAEPDLILCDEVTSALDTVVGEAILDLLSELRRELQIACVFISHDISTVRSICDDIMVLYAGHMVDMGPRSAYVTPPFHPYTDLLISSVPEMREGWLEDSTAARTLPMIGPLADDLALCGFLPRCAARIDGVCTQLPPPLRRQNSGKYTLCHHEEEALLRIYSRGEPVA